MVYGDGGKFLRDGVWYARFYRNGRRIRESLHTADERLADKRLAALRRQKDRGTYQDPTTRRALVGELLDDLALDFEDRRLADVPKAKSHMKAVREELGHFAARELETADVKRAWRAWTRAGRAPATVSRRLQLLRQAYRFAARSTPPKVVAIPYIPLPRVHNARQGFLSGAEIARLVGAIADADVRDFVEWFGWTAMRPNEIRQLTWTMVDLQARTLNLDPRAAKIRKGRVLALEGALWEIIQRRLEARRLGLALVFHRTSKGRPGQPVRDYRRAFSAAVKAAGLRRGIRPYDLRRSVLRNMVRAGVDIAVAMKISGHRTRATFDRYNITSAEDIREAMVKTEAFIRAGGGKP